MGQALVNAPVGVFEACFVVDVEQHLAHHRQQVGLIASEGAQLHSGAALPSSTALPFTPTVGIRVTQLPVSSIVS